MPTSGEYSNTLWVCVDPNSPACAEFNTIPLTVELGSTEPGNAAVAGISPAADANGTGASKTNDLGVGKLAANVVVSGFEPFGTNPDGTERTVNTSEEIANQIQKDNTDPLIHIREVIMPLGEPGYLSRTVNDVLKNDREADGAPTTLWLALGEDQTGGARFGGVPTGGGSLQLDRLWRRNRGRDCSRWPGGVASE